MQQRRQAPQNPQARLPGPDPTPPGTQRQRPDPDSLQDDKGRGKPPHGRGLPIRWTGGPAPQHRLSRPRSLKTGWRPRCDGRWPTETCTPALLAGRPPPCTALPSPGLPVPCKVGTAIMGFAQAVRRPLGSRPAFSQPPGAPRPAGLRNGPSVSARSPKRLQAAARPTPQEKPTGSHIPGSVTYPPLQHMWS